MNDNGTPKPNGENGRDGKGRFAPGNRGGPGNPNARAVGKLRSEFLSAVSAGDVRRAAQTILAVMDNPDGRAKDRLFAARELLLHVLGQPIAVDVLERLEILEKRLEESEFHYGLDGAQAFRIRARVPIATAAMHVSSRRASLYLGRTLWRCVLRLRRQRHLGGGAKISVRRDAVSAGLDGRRRFN
jgi:hypothetical protein